MRSRRPRDNLRRPGDENYREHPRLCPSRSRSLLLVASLVLTTLGAGGCPHPFLVSSFPTFSYRPPGAYFSFSPYILYILFIYQIKNLPGVIHYLNSF
jgi:hypothetical protein